MQNITYLWTLLQMQGRGRHRIFLVSRPTREWCFNILQFYLFIYLFIVNTVHEFLRTTIPKFLAIPAPSCRMVNAAFEMCKKYSIKIKYTLYVYGTAKYHLPMNIITDNYPCKAEADTGFFLVSRPTREWCFNILQFYLFIYLFIYC